MPALKPVATVLLSVLMFAAVSYWMNERIFTSLIDMAVETRVGSPAFILGNCLLMTINIILPALGGAFLVRLVQHALRPPKASRNWVR
jgi:hypothetical protein